MGVPGLALQERQVRLWATGIPWRPRYPPALDPAVEDFVKRTSLALEVESKGQPEAARKQLAAFLERGLTRRIGRALTFEERAIYEPLIARGLATTDQTPRRCWGLGCGVVFVPRGRSRHCLRCRDAPATRPSPRAHHCEDGLPVIRVGDWTDPGSRRLTYEARCELCQRGFTAHDPRTQRCLACRDGAGRQRLHRGGGVATKVYRFAGTAHLSGCQKFTVSFNRGYGDEVLLEATAGVVETTDAEEAKHLQAMSYLRRL
jgi:hypothetical protein